LVTHELKQNFVNTCVYFLKREPKLIVTIFIDDGLCCCADGTRIDHFLRSMNDIFETKVSNPELYVGFQIERDRAARLIYIHQHAYLKKVLLNYSFHNYSPTATPVDSNSTLYQYNLVDTTNRNIDQISKYLFSLC
jgi:thiamine pyrophosphokinase